MSRSYIPENTCSICSFQMNPDPRKLIKSRNIESVWLHSEQVLILTIEDRALEEPFKCRKPASGGLQKLLGGIGLGVGTAVAATAATATATAAAAAGASVGLGVALLSNPFGWCVLGAFAVGLIIWGAISLFNTKPCDTMLEISKWEDYYEEAMFNGYHVILQASFIACENGGILVPILNESIATKAASNISSDNNKEALVSGSAALIGGILFPLAIPSITSIGGAFAFFGKVGVGTVAINIGTNLEAQILGEVYGNDFYHGTTDAHSSEILDFDDGLLGVNDPSDITHIKDFNNFTTIYPEIAGAIKSANLLMYGNDTQLFKTLDYLSGKTTAQLKTDPVALQFFKDLQSGKYPRLWRQFFQRSGSNRVPKVNSTNVGNAYKNVENSRSNLSQNFKSQLGKSAQTAGGIYVLVAPFLSTYFGTSASIELAKAVEEDMK